MLDFFRKLFDTDGFPPRWHCGSWSGPHGWLHILSDLAVFGAYAAIPISIAAYIVVKKQEVAFRKLYWLFAGFILSCGFTHLIDATLFWHPWYRLSGSVKLLTAILSWATVVALIQILPVAMRVPGTAKLAEQLTAEIEERRRSEAASRELSTRLSLAMEHSRLGDWSWDVITDECHFSARAAEILGIEKDPRKKWQEILDLLHPEDRAGAGAAIQKAIADHADYDDQYRVTRADGQDVWVSATGRAQYAGDGSVTGFIGTLADITERKNADVERERLLRNESLARSEAERANVIKDEFLATLSHELRTPLNAILGWASMLRQETVAEDELKAGLEVIERNSNMQARLIEDLLDMSRIISGKVRLDVQPVDLAKVIEAALDAVRPAAESKKIRLVSILDPRAGPVRGDPTRLQQVVWNLLTNATKFTPSGGKVEVALERVNSHIEITVTDTGMGIESDFLPHIFDRFRQADSSITRKHGGLGLGLSLVKNLVEMHGGSVHAKSPGPGLGATFRIALPLMAAHHKDGIAGPRVQPATPGSREGREEPQIDLTGAKVLVVDDEPDCVELLQRILEKRGATVTKTSSGEEALTALSQRPYHLLISDIGMPVMDGFQLIQKVRSLDAASGGQIPALALTAFARTEDRRRAMTAGFDNFISKPVDPAELLAVVFRSTSRGLGK